MLTAGGTGRRREGVLGQSLLEAKTEPWQFPYRNLFCTPPRLSVAWATNCFPSLPELVGFISTTIPLTINKRHQLSQDTQSRVPGRRSGLRGQGGGCASLPGPGAAALGNPSGLAGMSLSLGPSAVAPLGEGEKATQVRGSDAGLAPSMSSCWPRSSSLGKRVAVPALSFRQLVRRPPIPPRIGWSCMV